MKKSIKKKVIISLIIVLLVIVVSFLVIFGTSLSISLKSEYVSFTEENGIITEVKFSGPFSYNIVELTSEAKNNYDENGNITQVINIYEASVKKSFFYKNEPTINIEKSDTVEYIYQFNLDNTIIINNGVIVTEY